MELQSKQEISIDVQRRSPDDQMKISEKSDLKMNVNKGLRLHFPIIHVFKRASRSRNRTFASTTFGVFAGMASHS